MPRIIEVNSGMAPVLVTASLQQGVVADAHLGLAIDGILASVTRRLSAPAGTPGSLIDGGLNKTDPHHWELPLAKCDGDGDWHWACGHGRLLNSHKEPLTPDTPDVHQLSQRPDERRAPFTTTRIPADMGGRRGRFRPRLRPVLNTPAPYIQWAAVGVPHDIEVLLQRVHSVGARRGSGEGAVLSWDIETVHADDLFSFVHLNHGTLSRPMPVACAYRADAPYDTLKAGLRPPYFHPTTQKVLAIPAAP